MTTAAADLRSLSIRVTKGNELTDFTTEDFQAGGFQASLATAMESTKVVRVQKTVVALGTRGDYLELVGHINTGTADCEPGTNCMYVEFVDYTGVPSAVQHTIFGKYSPFISPKEAMNESMLDGIDRQELSIVNTEAVAANTACKTGKSQYVRGSLDTRITLFADHNDMESASEVNMKFKPNSDGVIMIRAGARIWGDSTANVWEDVT